MSSSSSPFPSPYDACILACRKCIVACESVLSTVGETFPPPWAQAVHLCAACVRACQVAVEEMTLGTTMAGQTCALCAVLCRACAEECGPLPGPWSWVATACQHATTECHAVALAPARSA